METSVRYCSDGNDQDERTLLLGTSSSSSRSGHKDTIEPQGIYKSRWRSIRVMYLTMFLSSVSFSICMSSLYPYMRILDPRASTNFLGWVVASYSVGQLVASPFFGAWSNIRAKTREPLVVSIVINVLGNVLYLYLESIHPDPQEYLLLARALVGFGAGNIAVVRSYVAGATTLTERISAMANLSAYQSAGFIFGNLFQTAMVPLGYPGPVHKTDFHFDMYSATGLFSALVGIINILLLVLVFREHTTVNDIEYKYPDGTAESTSSTNTTLSSACVESSNNSPDYIAILTTIFLFFSVLFIFAVFETIVTPLGMDMFAWKKTEATLFVGLMLGCAGLVAIVVFSLIKLLAKRFNERNLLLVGFVICIFGYVSYLPWGHTYPAIQYAQIVKAVSVIYLSMRSNSNHTTTSYNVQQWRFSATVTEQKCEKNWIEDALQPTVSKISNYTMTTKRELILDGIHHPVKDTDGLSKDLNSQERQSDGISAIEEEHFSNNFQLDETILDASIANTKQHLVENDESNESVGVAVTQYKNITVLRDIADEEAVGCPYYFDWCIFTPVISLWQYLLGTFFISVGYPACSVISYTIFSKVLGPKPQGLWMGWLTAAGCLARTLGPVFVSQVYDAYGPRVAFIAMIGNIILAIIVLLLIYKRLVPFRVSSS